MSFRWSSCCTWLTGWYTGCGVEVWTLITSPSRTWQHWGTCWGPASWPFVFTCAFSSGTETLTWATECMHATYAQCLRSDKGHPFARTCSEKGCSSVGLGLMEVLPLKDIRALEWTNHGRRLLWVPPTDFFTLMYFYGLCYCTIQKYVFILF